MRWWVGLLLLAGCSAPRDPAAQQLIATKCAACHVVPGIRIAQGRVGPSLAGLANRQYIAGRLPNTPANLRAFLLHPQTVQPGGAMPELGLSQQQADAIAHYLIVSGKD